MQFEVMNFFPQKSFSNEFYEYSEEENSAQQISSNSEDSGNLSSSENSIESEEEIRRTNTVRGRSNRSTNQYEKSIMHNMQKHLFTFVVSLIEIGKWLSLNKMSESEICAVELMKVLKVLNNEKKRTKESLIPVFGVFSERIYKKSKKYAVFLENYSLETILEAKKLIKSMVIEKITAERISKLLINTGVQNKTLFKQYILTFLDEVKHNQFGSRITKQSRSRINDELNLWIVSELN